MALLECPFQITTVQVLSALAGKLQVFLFSANYLIEGNWVSAAVKKQETIRII